MQNSVFQTGNGGTENGKKRNGKKKKKTKIKKGEQVTITTRNGTGKGERRTGNGEISVSTNEPSG